MMEHDKNVIISLYKLIKHAWEGKILYMFITSTDSSPEMGDVHFVTSVVLLSSSLVSTSQSADGAGGGLTTSKTLITILVLLLTSLSHYTVVLVSAAQFMQQDRLSASMISVSGF